MSKVGDLKPVDEREQNIRDNAKHYNVVMFTPASSTRERKQFDNLVDAKEYSNMILQEPNKIRTAMIYAANEYDNQAMVGSIDRQLEWKEVIPARYK
jgi:hypothetical protein